MGEISVKTGNNARNGGKNSLNRLIRCVCGKKIGPDPRNFNQRVNLGRNDLLIRTFPKQQEILESNFTLVEKHDLLRNISEEILNKVTKLLLPLYCKQDIFIFYIQWLIFLLIGNTMKNTMLRKGLTIF
ncbi:hypothetical protein [Escherichia coli]|uniref:hypothetical protein n=2 Tax=Escherichia coli TaxID=562 RepID=UPI003A7FA189